MYPCGRSKFSRYSALHKSVFIVILFFGIFTRNKLIIFFDELLIFFKYSLAARKSERKIRIFIFIPEFFQQRVFCLVFGLPFFKEIAVSRTHFGIESVKEFKFMLHERRVRFFGFPADRKAVLAKLETEYIQRAVFNCIGIYRGFLCAFGEQYFCRDSFRSDFAFFIRFTYFFPNIDDICYIPVGGEHYPVAYILPCPACGRSVGGRFFRQTVCIFTQSLYQHIIPSLYLFTSITPSIICGW